MNRYKFKHIAIATVATVTLAHLFASCTKKVIDTPIGDSVHESDLVECILSAQIGGASFEGTKVALNTDGSTPNWETGDVIFVLDEDKNPVGTDGLFTLQSGDGLTEGKFKGTMSEGQTPKYAIYPPPTVSDGNIEYSLPTVQDGSIKKAVMMGTVSDESIDFHNVCSVIKINTGANEVITSIKVNGTALAGTFTPDWENTTLIPANPAEGLIVVAPVGGESFSASQSVFIPIFASTTPSNIT